MFRRFLTTTLAIAMLGVAVNAQYAGHEGQQTPAPQQSAGAPIDTGLRQVVLAYESVLKDAIDVAGTKLSAWAQQIAPQVYLIRAASPVVTSILQPDNSLAFDVRIAEILPSSVDLFNYYASAQQMANPGKIVPTEVGVPPPPVAAPPPSVRNTSGGLNPNQRYSDYVRDEIIDTMVDAALMLPIGPGQTLTVQLSPVNVAVQNPLYYNTSRRLSLYIKGDDLVALRQKTITREEAMRARGRPPFLIYNRPFMHQRARVRLGFTLGLAVAGLAFSACSAVDLSKALEVTDVVTGYADEGVHQVDMQDGRGPVAANKLKASITFAFRNTTTEALTSIEVMASFWQAGGDGEWDSMQTYAVSGTQQLAARTEDRGDHLEAQRGL